MEDTGKSKRGNLGIKQDDTTNWEIGEKYELGKKIGAGSYGNVHEATVKATGKKVAIKRLHNIFEDNIDCKRILREIKLLRCLKHETIVELLEVLEPKDPANFNTIYMIMEYAQSDIKKLVKSAIYL